MKESAKVLLGEAHLELGSDAERVVPRGMSAAEAALERSRRRRRRGRRGGGSFISLQR